MKKITFLLISFIATITMASAQNLVQNGSFETWTANVPDNWIMISASGSGAAPATNIVSDGTTSCKVTATATTNWSQSTITITPGTTYTLAMSYYIASGDGTDARIWCNFKNSTTFFTEQELIDTGLYSKLRGPGNANSSGSSYFPDEKGAWKTYTTTFTAPAAAVGFDFQFRTYSNATVYWDNFSLVEGGNAGIGDVVADKGVVVNEVFYNLQGATVAEPLSGQTYIKKTTYDNGAIETTKFIKK